MTKINKGYALININIMLNDFFGRKKEAVERAKYLLGPERANDWKKYYRVVKATLTSEESK